TLVYVQQCGRVVAKMCRVSLVEQGDGETLGRASALVARVHQFLELRDRLIQEHVALVELALAAHGVALSREGERAPARGERRTQLRGQSVIVGDRLRREPGDRVEAAGRLHLVVKIREEKIRESLGLAAGSVGKFAL